MYFAFNKTRKNVYVLEQLQNKKNNKTTRKKDKNAKNSMKQISYNLYMVKQ